MWGCVWDEREVRGIVAWKFDGERKPSRVRDDNIDQDTIHYALCIDEM